MTRPRSDGAGGVAAVWVKASAGDSRKVPSLSCAAIRVEHFTRDFGIGGLAGQPGDALGRGVRQPLVKERVDPGPLLRGHAPPSSFFSQARATIHDRFTVAGDTPSTSAVSSMVRPPK